MNSTEKEVLRIIGESTTSPDVFKNTADSMVQIRDSINDAVQEIAMLTGGKVEEFYLPLIANSTFYRLKLRRGHFGWAQEAWLYSQNRRLVQTDLLALNAWSPRWMEQTGTPHNYFPVGLDIIGITPKPTSSSDVLALRVAIIPQEYLHGESVRDLRSNFLHAVVQYAVSEYFASRGDARMAGEHYALYVDGLGSRLGQPRAAEQMRGFGVRSGIRSDPALPARP